MGGPGVTTRQAKTDFEKAEVLARVAEAQAQVKKWMEEFDEQDSKRMKKLGGKSTAGKGRYYGGSRGMIEKGGRGG